ncbi:MAG: proline hydroxylase [Thermobacillus sp. ZCTH02-B1]|uniref:2OG-Fe(II) oxygenase n=1 Tax=Thermobacillus sp. ZCTH02-B1 TaxID=1858795 RepID=UPI000B57910C|nr:2OG-Fe(II) oxygenase [Thermobacillus sp. ZCTH02-B1]OUM97356.1 MAG: proline hydroxylase [Thermobacillus sp. ZCTH02-B1]
MSEETSILPVQSVYPLDDCVVEGTVLNREPLIMRFERVLTDDECRELIESAAPRLKESRLVNKVVSEIRTSRGMFFEEDESPFISRIERRIAQLMHVPVEHAEGLQVLHYGPGQEYRAHHDYFAPGTPSARNNRISTLVIYLNDVEEGGETVFPLLEIAVKPKRGSAVYFEYFYGNPELNHLTLHSSAPVIRGEKWVATQWMRRQRVRGHGLITR